MLSSSVFPWLIGTHTHTPLFLDRYDAFVYLDMTRAVHAVKPEAVDLTEIPDLYPWGV